MTWRLAKSLETLRSQINALSPNRSKSSDGSIGDEAHASRSSDHNPWVDDRVVTAIDITHDPAHGVDSEELAETLRASRDTRIKFIISNRKIASFDKTWTWRAYTGSNPHDHHVHISVRPEKALYDSVAPWKLTLNPPADVVAAPAVPDLPVLRSGMSGPQVEALQKALNGHGAGLKIDGDFGPATKAAVQKFQSTNGLVADGIVGAYTWRKLGK